MGKVTVIQTMNDYDKDVFNGDIGQVVRVDLEEGEVVVSFEGREVTYDVAELDEVALAYATTVHKSLFEKYQAASRLSIKRVIATYTNVSLVVGNSS